MTKLYDGQLTDLILNNSRYNVEVRAISYALLMEKQRLINLAQRTRTMAVVDELPEDILDVLAVELRTPYYTGDMTIEQKRSIIKGTLVWFYKAGTPAAVAELVASVFGEGKVVEWFDFTEEPITPGTFDIVTNARMTEELASEFLRIIQRVKNTRSHIRRVLVERRCEMNEHAATGTIAAPQTPVLNHKNITEHGTVQKTAKAGAISAPATSVISYTAPRAGAAESAAHPAAGAVSAPAETIMNNAAPRSRATGAACTFGMALAVRDVHVIIQN